ncbi:MAG: antibiotic biosynthesis monooxygenase [Candidatus Riflebacteria bacterium]|nr:antibiotic biosynthesis monooxygenase [Candidatus Riflebacteria bacterium]
MTKLFRVSLLFFIAVAIFSLVGCQLFNPSDSDDNYIPVVKSLVIPVVLPSTDVVGTDDSKVAIRGNITLATPITILINNVATQSMGLPKYWAQHPDIATMTIVFFAKTTTELGLTDTSAIGTFTMDYNGKKTDIPAGRFEDILVTTALSLSTEQVVAGVAKAMGLDTTQTAQNQIPTIVSTVARITLTKDATGQVSMTTEKITIANGAAIPAETLGNPDTPLSSLITVITYANAKTGKELEAKLALLELVKASRLETGCISYDLYQGNNASIYGTWGVATAATLKFVEVQKFKDEAALNAHLQSAHVTKLLTSASNYFDNAQGQTTPFVTAKMYGNAGPDKTESGMLRYFGILKAAAGSEDKVKTAMVDLVSATRANEPNTLRYDLFQGALDTAPTNWIIYQCYKDSSALSTHLNAAYFTKFMTDIAMTAANAGNEGFFMNMISDPTPPAAPVVPDTAVTVVSYMIARPDLEYQARLELIALTAATRKEAGCISYDLFQADDTYMTNNPTVIHVGSQTTDFFVLRERWVNNDAVNFHMNTKHFKDFWAKKDFYFLPCAGTNSPFTVTVAAAGLAVQQDKAGKAMGPQLLITTEKQATFDATKQTLFDKIAAARNTSMILSYNLFEGGFGSPTNQLVVWERFTQSTTTDFYAPVGGFLDSAEGLGLRPEYAASVVLAMIKIRFINEVDCPSNASLRYDRITMESIPQVAPPTSFPGI